MVHLYLMRRVGRAIVEKFHMYMEAFLFIYFLHIYTYHPKGVFVASWENLSKQFSVALLSGFRAHPISTENVQFFSTSMFNFFSLLSCSLIFTTSKSCKFATFGALFC